jgi:ATP-dependent RNA helicase DeaD
VAALLDLATPALPCEPKDLGAVTRSADAKREKRDQDFVTFSISWGNRKGATTSRVLSQVCRRGGVSGQQIGAIQVGPGHSTFQIARQAAAAFEAKASRPDKRDPGVRIERLDGAQHSQRPPRQRSTQPGHRVAKAKPAHPPRPGGPKGYGKSRPPRKAGRSDGRAVS